MQQVSYNGHRTGSESCSLQTGLLMASRLYEPSSAKKRATLSLVLRHKSAKRARLRTGVYACSSVQCLGLYDVTLFQ